MKHEYALLCCWTGVIEQCRCKLLHLWQRVPSSLIGCPLAKLAHICAELGNVLLLVTGVHELISMGLIVEVLLVLQFMWDRSNECHVTFWIGCCGCRLMSVFICVLVGTLVGYSVVRASRQAWCMSARVSARKCMRACGCACVCTVGRAGASECNLGRLLRLTPRSRSCKTLLA